MRNVLNLLVLVLVVLVVGLPFTMASWEYKVPPKPAEDIINAVIQVPRNISEKFGDSDRVVTFYNLIILRDTIFKQEKTIEAMEERIKALEVLVLPKPEPEPEVVK